MDLAGIQARLLALGVTLSFEDDPAANAAQLITQRQYRAALYVDRLEATRDFLTNPLTPNSPAAPIGANPNALAPDYAFAQPALAGGAILNDLAESLDEWICTAVEEAIAQAPINNQPTRYEGWFINHVFDPVLVNYNNNVTAFFNAFPLADHALTQITDNFQRNVATAARRIVNDRTEIADLFSDLYYHGLTLNALTGMRSTGSDFHKGGMQVLVLTFKVAAFFGYGRPSDLRLIYKPTDMELDCLVTGNSTAVNQAIPPGPGGPFLANSLVELFNLEAAANGPAGTEPLPTYRILPRSQTSGMAGPGVPVRQAYGYSEYLGFSLTGVTRGRFNYYPFGASDYVIFRGTRTAPVIARFYHQMGQLLAIASIFSLTDLHVENVRVRGYQPHLIDLEAALTMPVADIGATLLFLNAMGHIIGGIDGWQTNKVIRRFNNAVNVAAIAALNVPKINANRLVRYSATAKQVVAVDPVLLAEGLDRGLTVLAALQGQANTIAWFARAQNVLVRLLPVATQEWLAVRRTVYDDLNQLAPLTPLANAIGDEVLNVVTNEHNNYVAGPAPVAPPEYLAPACAQATTDVTNFDIPVFYNRNGAVDMLDSTGAVIAMPANVNLNPPGSPAVATGFGPGGARVTYYAAAPATAAAQLAALPAGLAPTTVAFTNQILQHMGLLAMPPAPAVVL
jgi:hypothetical protein